MPARTRGHAFVLPGSLQGAGQLEREEQNKNQNRRGFPINCCGLKRGGKFPEGPLGLEWLF